MPRLPVDKMVAGPTRALDNLIGTCEIKTQRLLTGKVSQTGGLTDTLKGNPPHLSPRASARSFGKDGDSSAPSVHASGQAGADQQATLRNLFPRRRRFGSGRESSPGAAAPFAPIKTTGRAATLAAEEQRGREAAPERV